MKPARLTAVLAASALFGIGAATTTNHAQASTLSKWGATKLYTTPKAVRGTWYTKSAFDNKVEKFKITAHKYNNVTLYKTPKNFSTLLGKFEKQSQCKQVKLRKTFSKIAEASTSSKFHGVQEMYMNNWLPEMGFGVHYVPVIKTRKGVKTRALRLEGGASHQVSGYAYPSKKLAK